jgi:hypothetical protein
MTRDLAPLRLAPTTTHGIAERPVRRIKITEAAFAHYNAGVTRAVLDNRNRAARERARDITIRNLATKAEAEGRRR